MVSINLSDFFHDILIIQASRPVSRYGDQRDPRMPTAPLETLDQTKNPADAPRGNGGVSVNSSCLARNASFSKRLNGAEDVANWGY